MIKTNELKGLITSNNLSQRKVAEMMGITDKTFYLKMKKGVFDSDEIEQLISILNIKDPVSIFFAK